MDHETFPTGNPAVYAMGSRLQRGQLRLAGLLSLSRLLLFHRQALKDVALTKSKKPASPLTTCYFSTTPYAFGTIG